MRCDGGVGWHISGCFSHVNDAIGGRYYRLLYVNQESPLITVGWLLRKVEDHPAGVERRLEVNTALRLSSTSICTMPDKIGFVGYPSNQHAYCGTTIMRRPPCLPIIGATIAFDFRWSEPSCTDAGNWFPKHVSSKVPA
jgi:hypothetical protein